MKYFDLHCDTLTELGGDSLSDNRTRHISLDRAPAVYIQCWAVFIPDELRGDAAYEYYRRHCELFGSLTGKHGIVPVTDAETLARAESVGRGGILTVEGGAVLGGELSRIEQLARDGVRMLTLTWNGANELGCGSGTEKGGGLTDFGKQAVRELENCGILVDASHLNDEGFDDLCETAQKPFVASHSNSFGIYDCRRNLKDRQAAEIILRGGLIGINLYDRFISHSDAGTAEIAAHISRFASLGGEDCIAFGADFDGIDTTPDGITGIESIPSLKDGLVAAGIGKANSDKYFYGNAYAFFNRVWRTD